jgi:SOS-response transcriptional repressor LexA
MSAAASLPRRPNDALSGIPVRAETAAGWEGAEAFALQVLGDSMLPEFAHGDVVIVEPGGRLDDGVYVVARVGDEWMLRQLRQAGAAWSLVVPGAPEQTVPLADLAAIRGVVIQKSKPGRRSTIKHYV